MDVFGWVGGAIDAITNPLQAIQNGVAWILCFLLAGLIKFVTAVSGLLTTFLTPFNSLQTVEWQELSTSTYNVIKGLCDNVVMPVAMMLFALVMMIRLLNVVKVAEGNDMTPLVPRIITTLIMFFLGATIIQNSFAIITVGYTLMQDMISGIFAGSSFDAGMLGSFNDTLSVEDLTEAADGDLTNVITALFGVVMLLIASIAGVLVALFSYYSKILIMYIQAFLSPLGLMFLFGDATKQWGMAYIKGVASNFLGIVLVVLITQMMPTMIDLVISTTGFHGDAPGGGTTMGGLVLGVIGSTTSVNAIAGLIGVVVVYILMIFFMIQSSKIASSLFNG